MGTLTVPPCDTLATQLVGAVLHITLNRPEVRNAMSLRMVQELREVLAAAEASGAVRVLVLRGAGGHFCAGADLKDLALARMRAGTASGSGSASASASASTFAPASASASAGARAGAGAVAVARESDAGLDAATEVNAKFGELCVAYAGTPLALVAVLEGTVMGGGFGLACVADVALATTSAVFRLPETGLGVVPAQIAPYLVERLGYSQAKRLAVTGGRVDAAAALALGLAHAVHSVEQIDAAVAAVVGEILACAPGALAATKALIATARFTPPAEMVQEAAAVFSRAASGPEGIEGTTAFLQKRKPNWAPQ